MHKQYRNKDLNIIQAGAEIIGAITNQCHFQVINLA